MHFQNGASSYSTISQLGTKLHSAAMSSPHLGKNLVQKASPPLPYGLYSDHINLNDRTEYPFTN